MRHGGFTAPVVALPAVLSDEDVDADDDDAKSEVKASTADCVASSLYFGFSCAEGPRMLLVAYSTVCEAYSTAEPAVDAAV